MIKKSFFLTGFSIGFCATFTGIIFGVTYNKTHLNDLLNSGFVPQGDKAFVDSVYLYAGRVPPNEDTE